ncbi:hypothetical protein T03_17136 [Trichinella britovi]|uniref:Uncharacterized protein n=1 Tax=Trichinella britovi TaxID=45882 RepID=A0A0V1DEJ3_TRIBR|nr:hypothetical protein T03_17136 [Trichinella britovi]KRZ87710.1 hypothetical protein T08_12603 [Trichinella sp. T8]
MEKEKEKQRQSHNDGQIMFYLFYKNTSFTIFLFKRRIARILQGSCIGIALLDARKYNPNLLDS